MANPLSGTSHPGTAHASGPATRVHFMDNLRTFVVLLVVIFHAGVVYENSGIGAIFWIVDDPSTDDRIDLLNILLDIFVMPAIFLVSGYLAPASLESRGARAFLAGRARRLMLPWAIAVMLLMPIYKIVFLASRGLPQEDWMSYLYFSNGIFSQSWLWFLPILFAFDLCYAALHAAGLAPRKPGIRGALALLFIANVAVSIAMDLGGLQGWTKNALVNFQNERLFVYFTTFLFGSLCWHQRTFASRPGGIAPYIAVNCLAWIPVMAYGLFVILPFVAPGKHLTGPLTDRMLMWVTYHVSLIAILYLLLESFRRYVSGSGPIRAVLNRNSYSVYIIHVIVLGFVAWGLLPTGIPAIGKHVILSAATFIASNLLVQCYRVGRHSAWVTYAGRDSFSSLWRAS